MTVNWQDLLTNVGSTLASGTVVLGAAAYVVKTLVSHRMTRDAEAFKIQIRAEADAANEHLKNSLQMIALEHQVRFSKLHEKRAEVIEEVYQRLVELEKEYGSFVLLGAQTTGEESPSAISETEKKMHETYIFIEKRRIYLPPQVCGSLQAFVEIMWNNLIHVRVYREVRNPTSEQTEELHKHLRDGYAALRKDLPAARALLEAEFRKLLG